MGQAVSTHKLITKVNRTLTPPGKKRQIDYIVLHYYGAISSAKANAQYFYENNRQASAHYFVDETSIWQVVEENDVAWHVGGGGNGKYKDKCTNANSIAVELKPNKINRKFQTAGSADWFFDDSVIQNGSSLVRALTIKHNIPIENVIRHYDVTKKLCPRPFVGDDINVYYKTSGNVMWKKFKENLLGGADDMTQKDFNELMDVYLKERGVVLPGDWSKEARLWAEKNNLIVGTGTNYEYNAFVTREQLMVFLKRLEDHLKTLP